MAAIAVHERSTGHSQRGTGRRGQPLVRAEQQMLRDAAFFRGRVLEKFIGKSENIRNCGSMGSCQGTGRQHGFQGGIKKGDPSPGIRDQQAGSQMTQGCGHAHELGSIGAVIGGQLAQVADVRRMSASRARVESPQSTR